MLESFGMLCSAEELGLESESDGILDLPQCPPKPSAIFPRVWP